MGRGVLLGDGNKRKPAKPTSRRGKEKSGRQQVKTGGGTRERRRSPEVPNDGSGKKGGIGGGRLGRNLLYLQER